MGAERDGTDIPGSGDKMSRRWRVVGEGGPAEPGHKGPREFVSTGHQGATDGCQAGNSIHFML